MKKFAKLLVLALVVAALAAIFAIPSSAAEGPVVFVATAGTGEGKTPDAPIGNAEGYVPDNKDKYKDNALLRALNSIRETGGTVVIVGPTIVDNADARTGTPNATPSEFQYSTPSVARDQRPTITITSVYGGVDYRKAENGGAKLVFDHAACPVANIRMKHPAVWKDLNIEYKYDRSYTSAYNKDGIMSPFYILCDYQTAVFDTGIECTSVEVITDENGQKQEIAGEYYPGIVGGSRTSDQDLDTNVTIKSGRWSFAIAGSHGHSTTYHATVGGNANLTIEGGKIDQVWGTGAPHRAFSNVKGNVNINITGGEIGDFVLTNGEVYTGPGINVTITDPAKLTGIIHHSPIEGEILPEVTATVNGQPYKAPTPEETTVPDTQGTPATQNPNVTTKAPATTKAPETTAPTTGDNKTEEGGNTTLIIIIVVAAVVIIGAVVVTLIIVKKKGKK
ncbi:MAG: hypothetical protein IKL40_05530 [Clostridia bacterium]|nr:hypothetical protein [Clostridia bacterium]